MGSIDTEVETVVNIDVHRDEVAVLWPEWAPIESLIDDMITGYGADQGTLIWQRENQNDPAALQGEILSADMLEFVSDLPESGLRLYAGVDVAAVEDPEAAARGDSDYWAFAALAENPSTDLAYLVRLRRKRGMTQGEAVEWIGDQLAALSNRFGQGVNKVLAESNNTQRWIVQAAQDEGYRIEKSTSSGEKDARIVDMSSKFERGEVLVWESAMNNWSKFISDEWCDFPTGAHDDRLDAIEIALRNLDRGGDDEWSSSDVGLGSL
jgi:predicted phage terminase large subunit-like protein